MWVLRPAVIRHGPSSAGSLGSSLCGALPGALATISVTFGAHPRGGGAVIGIMLAISWFDDNAVQQPLQQAKSNYEPLMMEMLRKLPTIKNADLSVCGAHALREPQPWPSANLWEISTRDHYG